MDQKEPVLGPLLARFSIRGHLPDPLGVQPNLENGRFWSQISESTNPPFFRKILAQTKFLDGGGATRPPPISENVPSAKTRGWTGWEKEKKSEEK